jgi:hypothetical protein
MNDDRLTLTVEATHQSLRQRLDEATEQPDPRQARGRFAPTDAFMVGTSRHLAAVEEVLVAELSQLPGCGPLVDEYLSVARRLEHEVAALKARLYGEQHVAYRSWDEVWDAVRGALARHNELELRVAGQLGHELPRSRMDELADAVYRAELRAPTRAHPYIPHRGVAGRVARRVWSVADRFWDVAEGRVVPQSVIPHPRDHSHDSLVRQYLTAEPRFDAHAPLVEHRTRKRRRRTTAA